MEKIVNIELNEETQNLALSINIFDKLGFSLYLPKCLIDLSDTEISQIFSFEKVPDIIKKSDEFNISFALHSVDTTDQNIADTSAPLTLEVHEKSLSRIIPGYHTYGKLSKIINGHTIACLLYRSYSLENDLYNIVFTFLNNNQLIQGSFSCLLAEHKAWTPIFQSCLDSLEFKEGEVA